MKWRWVLRQFNYRTKRWSIVRTGEVNANTEQSAKAKASKAGMPKGFWSGGLFKHFRQPNRRRLSSADTLVLWKVRSKRW